MKNVLFNPVTDPARLASFWKTLFSKIVVVGCGYVGESNGGLWASCVQAERFYTPKGQRWLVHSLSTFPLAVALIFVHISTALIKKRGFSKQCKPSGVGDFFKKLKQTLIFPSCSYKKPSSLTKAQQKSIPFCCSQLLRTVLYVYKRSPSLLGSTRVNSRSF